MQKIINIELYKIDRRHYLLSLLSFYYRYYRYYCFVVACVVKGRSRGRTPKRTEASNTGASAGSILGT